MNNTFLTLNFSTSDGKVFKYVIRNIDDDFSDVAITEFADAIVSTNPFLYYDITNKVSFALHKEEEKHFVML